MKQFKVNSNAFTDRTSEAIEKYLTDVSKIPVMSISEEVELATKASKGDHEAKEKLIKANLRFVITVAKSYQHMGLELPDLISEGNIGLIKAVDMFDPTKGFKLISYAVWWIRQSILQALAEHSRVVRIPLNQISTIGKVNKGIEQFTQTHLRNPSEDELAQILHLPVAKVKDALVNKGYDTSMDAPITDDGDSTLEDVMEDSSTPSTDSSTIKEALHSELESLMNRLGNRDREILKLYFGFEGREHTYEEIASLFDITHERVRQIKERALSTLRRLSQSKELSLYLG